MAKCHTKVLHFVTFREIWEPGALFSACHLPKLAPSSARLQRGNRKFSTLMRNSSQSVKSCDPFGRPESSRSAHSMKTASRVCASLRSSSRHDRVPLRWGSPTATTMRTSIAKRCPALMFSYERNRQSPLNRAPGRRSGTFRERGFLPTSTTKRRCRRTSQERSRRQEQSIARVQCPS